MAVELINDDEVKVKQRTILWLLVFIGFSVNYMIRININIALIDMLDATYKKPSHQLTTAVECLSKDTILNTTKDTSISDSRVEELSGSKQKYLLSLERNLLDFFSIDYEHKGFKWDENIQGQILGAFYYLHFVLQLPGGILASRYGTKIIFGVANLIGCLMCSLMPIASYLDYRLLIALRILQGLICSACWPAMHHLSAQWIPKNERGRFVSSYLGSSFGVAIFYPIFGFIMKTYTWEYVFHFCSIFGIVWWSLWQYFVYDSPQKHPRISALEKNYLTEVLSSSLQLSKCEQEKKLRKRREIPWRKILTCSALWVNTIAQFGGVWGLFTILTQGPSYFRFIHGWDSTKVGLLSGLPHLFRSFMAIIISQFMDYLLKNEFLSRNNVRKTGTAISTILNGLFVLGLAYSGCNATVACVYMILATASHGAVSSGPLAAIIDISPRYAGVLLGIVNMFCALPGFISPTVVSYFTYENQTTESWKIVFTITSVLLIGSGLIYVFFADSSQQDWNNQTETNENCDDDINGNVKENYQEMKSLASDLSKN